MSKPKFDPSKPFEVVDAGAANKPKFDPSKPFEVVESKSSSTSHSAQGPSLGHDLYVKGTENLLLGTRPHIAGVGGAFGTAAERMTRGDDAGLLARIKDLPSIMKESYVSERHKAQAEEADVTKRRPGLSTAMALGSGVAMAPLFAAKGVQAVQGAKGLQKLFEGSKAAGVLGSQLGATYALGHAESIPEAAVQIGLGAGTGYLAQTGVNAASQALPVVARTLGAGARKLASKLTGISETEISTLTKRADKVMNIFKRAEGDVSVAADNARTSILRDINIKRQKLNNEISDALAAPENQRFVDGSAIMNALEKAKAQAEKVTAQYRPGDFNKLKNLIDTTKKFIGDDGKISLQNLHAVKQELQHAAKSTYDANSKSVIFEAGELAAKAGNRAASEAKRLIDREVPGIAKANQQLSRMHAIEQNMNKNLVKAGKPEAAILAAGSGSNKRSARALSNLDKITGGDALEQAQNLAAGRTFYDAPWLPIGSGRESLAKMALGSGVGYVTSGGDLQGAAVGGALTSPFALKQGINLVRAFQRLAPGAQSAGNALTSSGGRAFINQEANNLQQGFQNRAIGRRLQVLQNQNRRKTD